MESTAKKLVHFQEETPKQGLYNPEEEHDACGVGFVADLTGTHTRATITDALHVLNHLTHRGACGCESETGDGAGIIVGMPDKFLRKVAKAEGVDLPPKGRYAVANIFFVKDEKHVAAQKKVFDEVVSSFGLNVLLWRKMPVRPTYGKGLGATAMACEPYQEQLFVGAPDNVATEQGFNALLFEVRQKAQYSTDAIMAGLELYICSLSANVVTYKGMLKSEQVCTRRYLFLAVLARMPGRPPPPPAPTLTAAAHAQVMEYYQDLEDVDFESHCAMVHSRYRPPHAPPLPAHVRCVLRPMSRALATAPHDTASCAAASPPTPSRPGPARTPTATSPTTARSTRWAAPPEPTLLRRPPRNPHFYGHCHRAGLAVVPPGTDR